MFSQIKILYVQESRVTPMDSWLLLADIAVRCIRFAILTENRYDLRLKSLQERPRHPIINICLKEVLFK